MILSLGIEEFNHDVSDQGCFHLMIFYQEKLHRHFNNVLKSL